MDSPRTSTAGVRAWRFRSDIQGLRGLAVLLVLCGHLWPERLPGGFVGVDVFFVISGYLITGLLLHEIETTGGLKLLAFWARRVRRLLPAATVVLLAVLAGTLLWQPRPLWPAIFEEVISSALYVQNWMLAWRAVDYMARGSTLTPVQHYWSLSIEEQFYFAWPLLMLAAAWIARRLRWSPRRIAGLAAGLVFSASLYLSVTESGPSAPAYFVTTSRAWELALGGLVAVFAPALAVVPDRLRAALGWVGLVAVALSAQLLTREVLFPGSLALAPTLGAAAMIVGVSQSAGSLTALLDRGPLRFIGDISYSLYLWHWPLAAFLGEGAIPAALSATLALVLATASYYMIERPFRKKRTQPDAGEARPAVWRTLAAGAIMVALVVGCAGGLAYRERKATAAALAELAELARFQWQDVDYPGATARDPRQPAPVPPGKTLRPPPAHAEYDRPQAMNPARCLVDQGWQAAACEYGDPEGKLTIALVGDSHTIQYLPGLEVLARHHGWRIVMISKFACIFSDVPVRYRSNGLVRRDCLAWNRSALDLVLKDPPAIVITSAARPVLYNVAYALPDTAAQIAGYRSLWKKLNRAGVPVGVICDNPIPYPRNMAHCAYRNPNDPAACARPRAEVHDRYEDPICQAAADLPAVHALDLNHLYCDAERCETMVGNVLVYRDTDHLTATWVRSLSPYLDPWIGKILRDGRPEAQRL